MTLESTGNSNEPSPVSRRTMLRGTAATAATVWTASAVTMMTAAPAAAASANLVFTSAAEYLNHTDAGTADPTVLLVSGTVTNNGPQPAQNVSVQFRIPKSLHATAPIVTTAPTVDTGSISGGAVDTELSDGGSDWVLTLTLSPSPLALGQSRTISGLRISFRDGGENVVGTRSGFTWDDAPFQRWGGTAFVMNNTATATNVIDGAQLGPASVVATPNAGFTFQGTDLNWAGTATSNNARVEARIEDMWITGRSSIGKLTIVVAVEKATLTTNVWHYPPNPVPTGYDAAVWEFTGFAEDPSAPAGKGSWTWTFESKHTGYAPSADNNGPYGATTETNFDGPLPDNSFAATVWAQTTQGIGNAVNGRRMVVSAPHANTTTARANGWG